MAKDNCVATNTGSILNLVKRVEDLLSRQEPSPHERILIALAGVPGSGKSTVSSSLVIELAAQGIRDVAILPMDGFHYTRAKLSTFENSDEAFRLRGAPFTFDAESFVRFVKQLRATPMTRNSDLGEIMLAPTFDHAAKDPVPNSLAISTNTRVVIVEGNYTLLDQKPWNEIAQCCAERWFVDVPVHEVRTRIAKRHLAAGIEGTLEAAILRANENDIPNGNTIRENLLTPDVVIEN